MKRRKNSMGFRITLWLISDVSRLRKANLITGFLKKVLFRQAIKHPRLQRFWGRLHTLTVYAMNYGGGALIETSGEAWVLSEMVRPACAALATPVVFDVG